LSIKITTNKLQVYDIEIVYKKRSELIHAGYLSRNYLKESNEMDNTISKDIETHINFIEKTLPMSKHKFQEVTLKDKTLLNLLKVVKRNGQKINIY